MIHEVKNPTKSYPFIDPMLFEERMNSRINLTEGKSLNYSQSTLKKGKKNWSNYLQFLSFLYFLRQNIVCPFISERSPTPNEATKIPLQQFITNKMWSMKPNTQKGYFSYLGTVSGLI